MGCGLQVSFVTFHVVGDFFFFSSGRLEKCFINTAISTIFGAMNFSFKEKMVTYHKVRTVYEEFKGDLKDRFKKINLSTHFKCNTI